MFGMSGIFGRQRRENKSPLKLKCHKTCCRQAGVVDAATVVVGVVVVLNNAVLFKNKFIFTKNYFILFLQKVDF